MEENKTTIVEKTLKSGITFGSALAMVVSYTTWKSIGWAIFHGLLRTFPLLEPGIKENLFYR